MPRFVPVFCRVACVCIAAWLAFGWVGCSESDRFTYATETDEPNYREGQALLKAGRRQEALTAFLKVIDKRRDDAPESHLEVGLLYVQHINDPLSAIYHFRKYLALRPNSPQAPLVRQRIDAAIREFARTLPAQPLESQAQRVDLVATLDRLKTENDALKQQLADARANRGIAALPADAGAASSAPAAGQAAVPGITFNIEPAPTVRTRPAAPAATTARQPAPVPAPTRPASTPAVTAPARPTPSSTTGTTAAAGARRHTVRPGDTLSKLAQQYYGNRAKWRDILAANRDIMRSEADLRAGMVVKIP